MSETFREILARVPPVGLVGERPSEAASEIEDDVYWWKDIGNRRLRDVEATRNFVERVVTFDRHAYMVNSSHQMGHVINPSLGRFSPLRGEVETDPEAILYTQATQAKAVFHYYLCQLSRQGGQGEINQPALLAVQSFLDSLQYACHMVDTGKLKLSYRDHFVHPVVVAAIGLKWLALNPTDRQGKAVGSLRELAVPGVRSQLGAGGASDLEEAMGCLELTWEHFVEFAWMLAAIYHDHGRSLLTLARLHALNDVMVKGTSSGLPVFLSYGHSSCFSDKSDHKACDRYFPFSDLDEGRDLVELLARVSGVAGLDDLLEARLATLPRLPSVIYGLESVGPNKSEDQVDGRLGGRPEDHAILSAVELLKMTNVVTPPKKVVGESGWASGVFLSKAFEVAAGAVVTHHLGRAEDDAEELGERLLSELSFDRNPLGCILRIADFAHNWLRPFLTAKEGRYVAATGKELEKAGSSRGAGKSAKAKKQLREGRRPMKLMYDWNSPAASVRVAWTRRKRPQSGEHQLKVVLAIRNQVYKALRKADQKHKKCAEKSEQFIREARNLRDWLRQQSDSWQMNVVLKACPEEGEAGTWAL